MSKTMMIHNTKTKYTKLGILLGAEFGSLVNEDGYALRIAATPRTNAFLVSLGIEFQNVRPQKDRRRGWYQVQYSHEADEAMQALVEFAAIAREQDPTFGQIELNL